ncbi:MAG: hypothetical protein FD135_3289 [Comamonadaceae bacterium]|nr:MAG: hypothetical protein FD135_3289 [Comamonadaceae bacterium]
MDLRDPLRHFSSRFTWMAAKTQQRIDHQIGLVGHMGTQGDACTTGSLVSCSRVRRGLVGLTQPGHDGNLAPLLQMDSRLKSVATIVAGTTGDPDALCMRRDCQRQFGHSQTGTLHQAVGG